MREDLNKKFLRKLQQRKGWAIRFPPLMRHCHSYQDKEANNLLLTKEAKPQQRNYDGLLSKNVSTCLGAEVPLIKRLNEGRPRLESRTVLTIPITSNDYASLVLTTFKD